MKPVDEQEGSYPPDHLQALEQDRRANAGREGTTRAYRSSWSAGDDGGRRPAGSSPLIDEIVREGARRMLAEALQAEVDAYIARFAADRDGRAGGWWCATARISRGRS